MTLVTFFLLGTFLWSGSAWLIQKPAVRPLLNTRRYYGPESFRAVKATGNLVVPGITVPVDPKILQTISALSDNFPQIANTDLFAGGSVLYGNFDGYHKHNSTALLPLQQFYIQAAVANKAGLPPNYKYFGNGNVEEILKQLLLTNPFFTSALQSVDSGSKLAISSYAKAGQETRYSKLIKLYDKNFPRVNVKFYNTLEVEEYKVYDANGNDITSKFSKVEALKLFLFTFNFYSEVIHAAIHIYDYINVIGLFTSTLDTNPDVTSWAATYVTNVPRKYFEVETKLFNEGSGALVSPFGFNSDRKPVLQYVVDELLKPWFHFSTASDFVEKFVFGYFPDSPIRDQFLTAFKGQVGLVSGFTTSLSAAVKTVTGEEKYKQLNAELQKYYSGLGPNVSNIKDIGAWIQLMSVLNIVHGSTFSFSRYIATPEFLPYRNLNNNTYNLQDVIFAVTVLGTTFGLSQERYVFTSQLNSDENKIISKVLTQYDKASTDLKTNYFNSIKNDPKFAEYGWLWTDYAPNLVDNKQITIATYV